MKKGRGKDHVWRFVRYKGDMATYAKCLCGYAHPCYKFVSSTSLETVPYPEMLYRYCPICGARKLRYIDEPIQYIDKYIYED